MSGSAFDLATYQNFLFFICQIKYFSKKDSFYAERAIVQCISGAITLISFTTEGSVPLITTKVLDHLLVFPLKKFEKRKRRQVTSSLLNLNTRQSWVRQELEK